jgi:lipopolysaccharide biosynthesis glycosyltransferase
MEKVLLVTIAIGDKYLKEYNTLFRKSQELYAKRHGYDFKVVTEFLETTLSTKQRSAISFQKILVCSQEWSSQYDTIIFVDADILINSDAPIIHEFSGEKIGIVDEYSQPSFNERLAIQIRMNWERTPSDYYKLGAKEFELETDNLLNTGVLILKPTLHKNTLENIYNKYVEKSFGHPRGFHFEQSAIGYELQINNNFTIIDNKWNAIWAINKMAKKAVDLQTFIKNNYFTHFAGGVDINHIPYLTY